MKNCRGCGKRKPLDAFPLKDRSGARRAYCRPCYALVRREADRRYCRRHSHMKRANSAAYRARKLRQTFKLAPHHVHEIKEIYRRAYELTRKTGIPHHVDHIYPLKHKLFCGLHVPWNLQVLPAKLNVTKSNKSLLDTLACHPLALEHVDEAPPTGCEGTLLLQQPHGLGRR